LDSLAQNLLNWYDRERRKLPWREEVNPYRTWVSEVMLQQTRVDTVIPYFERFMDRFPTVQHLAEADLDEVLSMWSGLGYYSRARNMHRAANVIKAGDRFPDDVSGLRSLPGVGEYISAAIASIAFGRDVATVDGNIARVMARVHVDPSPRKRMWGHAQTHLPVGRAGDYNQALMDLGARICIPKNPRCPICPVKTDCRAATDGTADQFPPPKPKRQVPEVHMACVAVRDHEDLWLGRRPNEGLWGGLWELPTVKIDHNSNISDAETWFGAALTEVGKIRHVLTHRVIQLRVYTSKNSNDVGPFHYDEFGRFSKTEMGQVGTSRLTEKALAMVLQSVTETRS